MKKIPVIVLVVLGLVFAGLAEAATPKKRTRNQNRIGPYGAAFVGWTTYTGDQADNEQELEDILSDNDIPFQNVNADTEDTDLGFQITFGYRFNRYIAGELGLVQYGELVSSASGELDFPNDGTGFVPANVALSFTVGGPLISVLGILPIQEKFEVYGRVGYLFASVEREFTSRVAGERGVSGSAKGDSQNVVYGAGFSWNINQVYTIRAEYQLLDNVGQNSRTGTEDLNSLNLGLIVRF
jgi:opacity protein-like surface antigen